MVVAYSNISYDHSPVKREVNDYYDTFGGDLNQYPDQALRKVITDTVVAGDQHAIAAITGRDSRWGGEVFNR